MVSLDCGLCTYIQPLCARDVKVLSFSDLITSASRVMIAAAFVYDNATAVLIDNFTDVSEANELLYNSTRDRVTHHLQITYSCLSNVVSLM